MFIFIIPFIAKAETPRYPQTSICEHKNLGHNSTCSNNILHIVVEDILNASKFYVRVINTIKGDIKKNELLTLQYSTDGSNYPELIEVDPFLVKKSSEWVAFLGASDNASSKYYKLPWCKSAWMPVINDKVYPLPNVSISRLSKYIKNAQSNWSRFDKIRVGGGEYHIDKCTHKLVNYPLPE